VFWISLRCRNEPVLSKSVQMLIAHQKSSKQSPITAPLQIPQRWGVCGGQAGGNEMDNFQTSSSKKKEEDKHIKEEKKRGAVCVFGLDSKSVCSRFV